MMHRLVASLALLALAGCASDRIAGPSQVEQPRGVRLTMNCAHSWSSNGPQPLFVVDGEPLSREQLAARSIRAEDIESMQLLKGSEAVSRYGPAAEHGVVLVTLKARRTAP